MSFLSLFLICFLSSFQIFNQSVPNIIEELSELTTIEITIISSIFPLGQIIGTLLYSFKLSDTLNVQNSFTINAAFILFGSLLQCFATFYLITIGRLLIGIGTGIGFVVMGVSLTQCSNYQTRPAIFLLPSIAFSLGNFFPNFGYLFGSLTIQYYLIIISIPNILVSFFFYFHGHKIITKTIESNYLEIESIHDPVIPPIIFKYTLLLMCLNVSVGVSFIMTFSIEIFKSFGYTQQSSTGLSFFYPLLQIIFLLLLNIFSKILTRKRIVLKGFLICFLIQVAITIILLVNFIDDSTKTYLLGTLTLILAIISSGPCSLIQCLPIELLSTESQYLQISAYARTHLWLFSFTSTITFPFLFSNFGLLGVILPHTMITGILLSLLSTEFISFLDVPQ
uniref:MFS domain-containing protein n=1 Tax=Rhabditophanes sp. KR3021 TaxID=114890 RepID=A0AC35TXM5_9BILA